MVAFSFFLSGSELGLKERLPRFLIEWVVSSSEYIPGAPNHPRLVIEIVVPSEMMSPPFEATLRIIFEHQLSRDIAGLFKQ